MDPEIPDTDPRTKRALDDYMTMNARKDNCLPAEDGLAEVCIDKEFEEFILALQRGNARVEATCPAFAFYEVRYRS